MSIPFGPIGAVYGDMYARGLGAALRGHRLYDLDYALQQDPEAYERMRRDPVIDFALHYRKLLAAGDSWFLEVKPLDEKGRLLVKIFETLVKQVERFPNVRYNLAEAAIKGSAWAKIWPETRIIDVPGLGRLPWVCAARVQDVDKRRLRQFPIDLPDVQREILVENPYALAQAGQAFPLSDRAREWVWQIYRPLQQRWEEIDRNSFVRHVYQDREDALGYGTGLAGTLYTFWWAKEQVLAHGLQFVERWAQGLVKVAMSTLRDGLASTPSAAARQQAWLDTFEKFKTRHILVHDKDDEMEVVPPPADGWTVITEALAYFDGAIRVAVLGASLPTEQEVDGGSFAMAKVQQSATDAVVRFDRSLLEETLTRDLIGYLWDANFETLEALGLTDRDPPVIKIRDTEHYDPQVRAEVIKTAIEIGLDVKKEEAYVQLGLTPPAPEDDVLEGKAAVDPLVAALGGGGPPGGPPGAPGRELGGPKPPGAPGEPKKLPPPQRETAVGEGESSVAEDEEAAAEPYRAAAKLRRRHRLEDPVQPFTFAPVINMPAQPAQAAPKVDVHFAAPPAAKPAPAPVVNLSPVINVAAAKAPQVIVEGAHVHAHVAAPEVKVEAPIQVDVEIKGGEKKIEIQRDGFGRVSGAEVTPKE